MKITNRTLPSILIIALSAIAIAQLPASKITPSVEQLRRHVTYLASDHLEGRRTGSAGASDAAHYIAGEFSQSGLKPAFQTIRNPRNPAEARSNYRQKFPYIAGVKLGTSNELSLWPTNGNTPANLRVGDDWMPVGFSSNTRVEKTPAVFVGYGITAPDLKYNDYATTNANGKIAVAFSGTPDDENPHDLFARHKDERWKAIAARNAGAKALVLIVRADNFHEAHLSRLRYDNSAGDAGLPVLAISQQAALTLFSFSDGSKLRELKQAWSTFGKATSQSGSSERPSAPSVNAMSFAIDLKREDAPAYNIIGLLEGSDPQLKKEAIVIGAHYDHLGLGGEGSLAQKEGEVHHGADDNASGVAGVLELARIFSTQRPRPRRTLVFIAFSGEEEGLLGSSYYVNNPVVPLANTVAMINMDMIGRAKDKKLVIGGVGTAQEWRTLIGNAQLAQSYIVDVSNPAAHSGKSMPMVVGANGDPVVSSNTRDQLVLTLNEDGYGPSDHSSFYAKQIPVLFFWTGTHSDYHKPSDTADKINYEDESRIVSLVSRIVRDVDSSDKRPTYAQAKSEATGRSTGFRVYLGTIPNYADASDGLLLDGIREDSPAAKAGLKAGDKIVKLAGRDVRNVYDYTYALGEMKAGQEYEMEVLRGSERLKLTITPAPRR
jgi:Peptidase family M28/PDZ domain